MFRVRSQDASHCHFYGCRVHEGKTYVQPAVWYYMVKHWRRNNMNIETLSSHFNDDELNNNLFGFHDRFDRNISTKTTTATIHCNPLNFSSNSKSRQKKRRRKEKNESDWTLIRRNNNNLLSDWIESIDGTHKIEEVHSFRSFICVCLFIGWLPMNRAVIHADDSITRIRIIWTFFAFLSSFYSMSFIAANIRTQNRV